MLSGLREAARALQLLRGPAGVDAAALVGSRTETLSKTDKRKRMEGERGRQTVEGQADMGWQTWAGTNTYTYTKHDLCEVGVGVGVARGDGRSQ